MRGRTTQERLAYWLFHDRIPLTKLLIVSNALTFLLVTLFHTGAIPYYLGFSSPTVVAMPWTAFTYPLVGLCGGVICLLLAGYWLWVAGGSLERSWGSQTFFAYFFLMSAVSALGLCLGGFLAGVPTSAVGLWLPLAGVTIAFAMLNPEEQILFFFVIPLKLKYLALLDVAVVLVSYGKIHILLGVFALTGCAASYWYVTSGRQIGFRAAGGGEPGKVIRLLDRRKRKLSLNLLEWYKGRRERKRLKDLFDRSGFKD